MHVAQDPIGNRVAAVDRRGRKSGERFLIATLCPFDESNLHVGSCLGRRSGCLTEYGAGRASNVQSPMEIRPSRSRPGCGTIRVWRDAGATSRRSRPVEEAEWRAPDRDRALTAGSDSR
jgi:hypothetical protein